LIVTDEKDRMIKLPERFFKEFRFYIEEEPDADYKHASEKTYEEFKDMAFAVRIHFGIYSMREWRGESWPFLWLRFAGKQKYQQLYKRFNPTGFNAEEWMQFFERSGCKGFAITTKHHEGFSLFDTKTRVKSRINWSAKPEPEIEECDLAYSVMETPFKRDIIKELCDAGHAHGIKIDLYFSHPDWYDADFRPYSHHPVLSKEGLQNPKNYDVSRKPLQKRVIKQHPNAEETERFLNRHRTQLIELLSNYGKIDMVCLDMRLGPDCWPHVKETIKLLRKIQPDVMFRNRGIANYGDYYTPEGFVPGDPANTKMPWMVIYPLGHSFSYEKWKRGYKGTYWVIKNLIDTNAKGGVFMAGIGPNGTGKFHPEAIKELEAAGEWLKVNGEGIYATRMWSHWNEGDNIRFTQSKDHKYVYAFCLKWPGLVFSSTLIKPKPDSKVYMLGCPEPLNWTQTDTGVKVEIPSSLVDKKPCEYAWGFKFEQ
jgi:alpha-L-fucosidase